MTFSEAISDAFSKYAGFSGRSSRAAYWWFYLFFLLALMAAAIIDAAAGTGGVVEGIVGLALFLPELAVTARRLHDAGHSAWWLLISVVPVIGFVVLLVFTLQGSVPPNKWGPGPTPAPRRPQRSRRSIDGAIACADGHHHHERPSRL